MSSRLHEPHLKILSSHIALEFLLFVRGNGIIHTHDLLHTRANSRVHERHTAHNWVVLEFEVECAILSHVLIEKFSCLKSLRNVNIDISLSRAIHIVEVTLFDTRGSLDGLGASRVRAGQYRRSKSRKIDGVEFAGHLDETVRTREKWDPTR